jgi:uncharacterized membrane protein (DUF485 family)
MNGSHDVQPEQRTFRAAHVAARNARYGLALFFIYLALYASFLVINTFRPQMMDWIPAAGVTLSVWYGFGLIIAALLLALVYCWLCRANTEERS